MISALLRAHRAHVHAGASRAMARRVAASALEPADLALGRGVHEAADGDEGGADPPRGLPALLVVARDAEADLAVGLEAARGRQEAEGGRAQRM